MSDLVTVVLRMPGQRAMAAGAVINAETRTVKLSVSNEDLILKETDDGIKYYEMLNHSPECVRLARLMDKANMLWNHCADDVLGVVESASLDADRILRCEARFSKSKEAEEIYQDVLDNIITKSSIGYVPYAARVIGEKDNLPIVEVYDWEPTEISLVSKPATHKVGIGRNIDGGGMDKIIIGKDNNMTDEEKKQLEEAAFNRGGEMERQRVAAITEIAKLVGDRIDFDVLKEVEGKRSIEDIRVDAFRALAAAKPQTPINKVGMSDKETKLYSLNKAVRVMMDPGIKDAGLELEVHRALAGKITPRAEGALIIPYEALEQRRDLTTTGGGAGIVPTQYKPESFIDYKRQAQVMPELGITYLTGVQGEILIPVQTSGQVLHWLGENSNVTPMDATFEQKSLKPKYASGYIPYSRALAMNSDPWIEMKLRMDLGKAAGELIDKACIDGDGVLEPLGIFNTDGVGTVSGASYNWQSVLEHRKKVALAKLTGKGSYLISTSLFYDMMAKPKQNNVSGFLIDDNERLAGCKAVAGNQIDVETNGEKVAYGLWDNFMLAENGVVQIWLNGLRNANANIELWIYLGADTLCLRPGAFAIAKDVVLA